MRRQDSPDDSQNGRPRTLALSIDMLRAVLEGETYESVAAEHGVSRTAVERRIKGVAVHVAGTAGIDGLNADGASFVRRLRLHRVAILGALERLSEIEPAPGRSVRILSDEEIAAGALRIRGRSQQPLEDLAL